MRGFREKASELPAVSSDWNFLLAEPGALHPKARAQDEVALCAFRACGFIADTLSFCPSQECNAEACVRRKVCVGNRGKLSK